MIRYNGQIDYIIPIGHELPNVNDLLKVTSQINGNTYLVTVKKIEKLKWLNESLMITMRVRSVK